VEDVTVANVDTDLSPFGLGTWASRGTVMGCSAVKAAAGDARRILLQAASELLGAKPETLIADRGQVVGPDGRAVSIADVAQQHMRLNGGAPVIGQGHFIPPGVEPPDATTKYGNISCAYPFGVQVAEVEVDELTGLVRVVKVVAVHDVGRLINPLGATGQVEGGIVQGMGFALSEQMQIAGGAVSNQNLTDYKIPTTMDVPETEVGFVEPQDPFGPYGAKGLSEPGIIPTAPAIANALYNAIGVRFTELPITPQEVLAALEERVAKRPTRAAPSDKRESH
jgi:CO/xanthine dehydrogenase Mo-binding subunit